MIWIAQVSQKSTHPFKRIDMQKLTFKPFSKEVLIEGLKKKFPLYKIRSGLGPIQVRTKNITFTGHVQLKIKPETGSVTTSTNLDMAYVLLIFCFPLGIYIFAKKEKIKQYEAEVIAGLKQILEPVN